MAHQRLTDLLRLSVSDNGPYRGGSPARCVLGMQRSVAVQREVDHRVSLLRRPVDACWRTGGNEQHHRAAQ